MTLASNAAAIIFMAVVFNIMCICSMHGLLSPQDLPIFFSDGETRVIVGGQRLITMHGNVDGGEEEEQRDGHSTKSREKGEQERETTEAGQKMTNGERYAIILVVISKLLNTSS